MQKLELTWIGKGQEPAVEPRILLHDASRDYGDPNATNMLIHGDNLLALKALEQEFSGRVKCIYIDPPYNTGSAFETYNDNLEHSIWLTLMSARLHILRHLLREDGFIFVQIDDNEQAYLRVLMDEIFGRKNFVASFIWAGRAGKGGTASNVSNQQEYIHCYQKTSTALLRKEQRVSDGGNYEDEEGKYTRQQLRQWGQADRREDRPSMWYPISAPDGSHVFPIKDDGSDGRWRVSESTFNTLKADNLIDIVKIDGAWKVYRKMRDGRVTESAYGTLLDDFGTSATGTAEIKKIYGSKTFDTPKPEKLIAHLIMLSSEPGDLVLDSFLGSGTTAAVAHKMGRQYIGIELGEHCYTHCIPRLKAVVDGEQGGISKVQSWQGGGGFKFYELAPTLIVKDENGFEIISDQYDATMLAAAVAKLCGYRFAPREDNPYIHGVNNVGGFIFVTTQYITAPLLGEIAKNISDTQSLVICASAFQVGIKNNFPNIKLRKIPQSVLSKCEYGADNYNLNVVELPDFEETEEDFEDAE